MTLQQIKDAVNRGEVVCYKNSAYTVEFDGKDYWIVWMTGTRQENSIGLTWRDGKTLNGDESDFFIHGD